MEKQTGKKKTWQRHIWGKLKFLKRKIVFTKDEIPELYFFLHMWDSETFTEFKKKKIKIIYYCILEIAHSV